MTDSILSWRTVQNSKKFHVNPVIANSIEHELRKFEVCYFLKKLNLAYYTECIFRDGKGRADIYVVEKNLALEILESESEIRFNEKKVNYPCRVIGIKPDTKLDLDTIELLVN
jgi:hypothetical protein